MNKPCYYIVTRKNAKAYSFESNYNQHDNIIKRNSEKGKTVTSISCYSTSTGKHLKTRYYSC